MFLLVKYLLTAHFAVVSASNIGGRMTTTAVTRAVAHGAA
jgi:hypothetical protein